ncbi:hypothetical protein NC652_005647 [Populus alba x Populus x berolinensis]|nr:hypothetical protein NC652_005647 [Populus alba x Populus x berolinensis]
MSLMLTVSKVGPAINFLAQDQIRCHHSVAVHWLLFLCLFFY